MFLRWCKFSLNTKFFFTSLLFFLFTYLCHFCGHLVPLLKFSWCSLYSRWKYLLEGGFIGPMGRDTSETAVYILHFRNLCCLTSNLGRNQTMPKTVVKTSHAWRGAYRLQGGIWARWLKRYGPPIWENRYLADNIVFLFLDFFHESVSDLAILTSRLSWH